MKNEEILSKVIDIIREEFEDESLAITDKTTAKDVDGWDSLTHLSLLHEIEKSFRIKFMLGEIQGAQNVGDLVGFIHKHLNE